MVSYTRTLKGDHTSAWKIPQGTLLAFNAQCLARSDIFKQPLNAVPNPKIRIPDTRTALNDFTFVEAAASKAKEALQSSNRTRSNVYTQITELTSKTGDLIAKQNKGREESDKLTREINDAIRLRDVHRDHLSQVANELKEARKEKVHCEFKNIVEAVSHVLLEAHEAVCINNLALKQDATITGNMVKHLSSDPCSALELQQWRRGRKPRKPWAPKLVAECKKSLSTTALILLLGRG